MESLVLHADGRLIGGRLTDGGHEVVASLSQRRTDHRSGRVEHDAGDPLARLCLPSAEFASFNGSRPQELNVCAQSPTKKPAALDPTYLAFGKRRRCHANLWVLMHNVLVYRRR
jgi:hypothetical protein